MQSLGKLASTNLVETSNSDMKSKEQSISERKGQESLDNIIRQTIGKDPFLSFTRSGENPVHWIQLLNALDQQNANKLSKGLKVEVGLDTKDCGEEQNVGIHPFSADLNGIKEAINSNLKGTAAFGKGLQSPSEHLHSLKIPEAVVAFAQAAAKANGEPEKYLPGWPLLSPSRVQMLKCDKCSREFCSPLNHRRHIRVHRRTLNLEKDNFCKKRIYLAEFWDKLSMDEARQIVSFKNIMLEEVPGTSIVRAMTSFIRKPGLPSLPQFYIKAGAALLDLVQAKSSRFPLPAKDLFCILDDASEKTFLCAGTALSVQKFVFAGEAGKVGLEVRNLVASMGFLIEQQLVQAWLVDKDAEALRCQKLLVEEEEAAEKKRADLLERKRLKKLRQKELKGKEHAMNVVSINGGRSYPDFGEYGSVTAVDSRPSSSLSEQDLSNQEQSGDVNILHMQRSGKGDYTLLKLFEQDSGQDCRNLIDENSVCLHGNMKYSDLYKDISAIEENCEILDAGHMGSTDTDLESRASQSSAAEVPVYPELDCSNHQGGQDQSYVDRRLVRGWRERKRYNVSDSVIHHKYLNGSERKLSEPNQQSTQKLTWKPSNGLLFRQVSQGGGTVSKSVPGQKFSARDKPLGRRTTSSGNGCRVWTRKAQQTARLDSNENLNSNVTSKDDKDGISVAKPVEPMQFPSNGQASEGSPEVKQKGLNIPIVKTSSTKSDLGDALSVLPADAGSDPGCQSDSKINSSELLIGSMSVHVNNFPNEIVQPRLLKCAAMPNSKEKQLLLKCPPVMSIPDNNLLGEFDSSMNEEINKASSKIPEGFQECPTVSNDIGTSKPVNDAHSKVYKPCINSLGDADFPHHPGGQTSHEKFAKQGSWQNGANKAVTKFWRPVGLVVDRHDSSHSGIDAISRATGNTYDRVVSIPDSKSGTVMGAFAECPLKRSSDISEKLSYPLRSGMGGTSCGDARATKDAGNDTGGRKLKETVGKSLSDRNGAWDSNHTVVHEHCNCEQTETTETINQRESKIFSACNAAATFLSQRWEDSIADDQAEVVPYPVSDLAEVTGGGYVQVYSQDKSSGGCQTVSLAPQAWHLDSGSVSDANELNNAPSQSGVDVASSTEVDGKRTLDDRPLPHDMQCDFGAVTSMPLSAECTWIGKSHELRIGAGSKMKFRLKSEKAHLKYMPRQWNSEDKK